MKKQVTCKLWLRCWRPTTRMNNWKVASSIPRENLNVLFNVRFNLGKRIKSINLLLMVYGWKFNALINKKQKYYFRLKKISSKNIWHFHQNKTFIVCPIRFSAKLTKIMNFELRYAHPILPSPEVPSSIPASQPALLYVCARGVIWRTDFAESRGPEFDSREQIFQYHSAT